MNQHDRDDGLTGVLLAVVVILLLLGIAGGIFGFRVTQYRRAMLEAERASEQAERARLEVELAREAARQAQQQGQDR
jgi:hypothetical protein